MGTEFDDDQPTPPRAEPTDSERRRHAEKWRAGVPAVVVDGKSRPTHWGDPERAAIGLAHRRTPAPVAPQPIEDVTPVFDLVLADDDPVTGSQFREAFDRLAAALSKLRRRSDTGEQERTEALQRVLASSPGPAALGAVQSDVAALKQGLSRLEEASDIHAVGVRDSERDMRLIKWIAGVAITFALGSVLTVLFRLLDKAEHDGETTIKLDHVERAQDHTSTRLDRIEQLLIRQPSQKDAP